MAVNEIFKLFQYQLPYYTSLRLHKKKNKEQNKNIKLKEGEEYLKNLTHEQLLDIARSKQREKKAF